MVTRKTVLNSAQDRAWFVLNVPQAWKSFLSHLMKPLGNVGNVESRFSPFGGSVNLSASLGNGLCRMYHMLGN